jgi:hypothetical protein
LVIIAGLVGLGGLVLILAAVLALSGSTVLDFLIPGFGILPLPRVDTGLVIVTLGLVTLGVSVGLWRLKTWAFILGLLVSSVVIIISVLSTDFFSFELIRALILFVYLLRFRYYFRAGPRSDTPNGHNS